MNLKRLFSVAIAAALGMGVASADQYIIKDGKLADGIEVLAYAEDEPGDVFEDGVKAPDGTTAAKITHAVMYNDVRFYKDDAFNLNDDWELVLEFYYPAGSVHDTVAGNKWEALDLGFVDDTVGGKYTLAACNLQITRDIKFKDPGDQWNTEKMFVYSKPTITSDKLITFGWQRQVKVGEGDDTRVIYIKNMYLTHTGNKPFFADNFENGTEIYNDSYTNIEQYTMDPTTGEVTKYANTGLVGVDEKMTSQLPIYAEKTKVKNQHVNLRRLFELNGTDGSEYYDCDVLHGLEILNSSLRVGRSFYFIPMPVGQDGTQMTSFDVDFISKWDANKTTEGLSDSTADEERALPIGYMCVDAPSEVAGLTATPLAENMLIEGSWTAYHYGDLTVDPSKKYIALCFGTNDKYSYVVDEIRLTAANLTCVGATLSDDPTVDGIASYSMTTSGVESIKASEALSIYPNPATSVVTVANEGVNNVVVYSLTGNVVAKVNGNSVNVSSLAKGIYVVKAYTNEGVIVGSIIKK